MNETGLVGLIGIAKRAGRLTVGTFQTEKNLKAGKALLILLDEGVSENTRKKLKQDGAQTVCLKSGLLQRALGEEIMVASLTDAGFAAQIRKYLD
jgi:ribosomal protein L7Ae-like RNA K-turn-binding protein